MITELECLKGLRRLGVLSTEGKDLLREFEKVV